MPTGNTCAHGYRIRAIRYAILASLLILAQEFLQPTEVFAQTRPSLNEAAIGPGIVIGFVGGFVHRNDLRHSEVQLGQRLEAFYSPHVQVEIFENRQIAQAHEAIRRWLDRNSDGNLSSSEKQSARIVLFGHSWGATAAILLARELQQDGVPVLLTIQVDSVSKPGIESAVIPANVSEAANFYQTKGILHGLKRIRAQDPSKTEILGNFRFQYDREPKACTSYPWYDRLFFKGHTAIECDPQVWSEVEDLIRTRLSPIMTASQVQTERGEE